MDGEAVVGCRGRHAGDGRTSLLRGVVMSVLFLDLGYSEKQQKSGWQVFFVSYSIIANNITTDYAHGV